MESLYYFAVFMIKSVTEISLLVIFIAVAACAPFLIIVDGIGTQFGRLLQLAIIIVLIPLLNYNIKLIFCEAADCIYFFMFPFLKFLCLGF